MATTLIRSRAMVTGVNDRHSWNEITDGAVLQEDGVIAAIGTYDDLSRRYPTAEVVGSGREILLPGFVNGHHHVGLTPLQLGSPDMPLELWFVTRMVSRNLNLYLDTLYSAFEMIASGITTVQHIHGWAPGALSTVQASSEEVIRAYEDIGMRVSYCFAVRDQNRLVYEEDKAFVERLPEELRGPMRQWFSRFKLSLDDHMDLFQQTYIASTRERCGSASSWRRRTCIGARTRPLPGSPRCPPRGTCRCTCICSRRRCRRNTRGVGEGAPLSIISTASACLGRA